MIVKKLIASNGEFYFTINAMNGRVIATSETYKRRAGMDNAVSLVTVRMHDAEVIDLTRDPKK